ncbi:nitroreductase family protein [archaeon]
MEAIECIKSRRSRRKFLDKDIPDSVVDELIDAARHAPFGGPPMKGPQVWEFIVVREQKTKDKLALHYEDRQWVAKAPVLIACCADKNRDPDYKNWEVTVAMAIQNLLLAAHSMGLGACYVATFMHHVNHGAERDALREALALPENIELVAVLTLGYPDPSEELTEKELRGLKEITHKEKF